MIKLATKIWGAATGAREWLTLLVVAAAAAWLYAQWASMRQERDGLRAFADVACAAMGSRYDLTVIEVTTTNGKAKRVKLKPGAACTTRARDLAAYERDSQAQSARLLAAALEEQARKNGLDAAEARRAAEAARAAARAMENANAAVGEDDRVGPSWFGALNGVAGLRAPDR